MQAPASSLRVSLFLTHAADPRSCAGPRIRGPSTLGQSLSEGICRMGRLRANTKRGSADPLRPKIGAEATQHESEKENVRDANAHQPPRRFPVAWHDAHQAEPP